MSLLTGFPSVSDDSGLGQDGTSLNSTFFSAIKSAVEAVTHSATNPTVDPNDITDEVVTLRGNTASANARVSGVIDADGNLITPASIVSASELANAIGLQNRVKNAKFATWSSGASSAPDNWTLAGTGAAVARTGSGETDTTRLVGQYAAKVTYGSATASLTQEIVPSADWTDFDYLEGSVISATVWIYTTTVNKVRAALYDGVTRTYFSNITLGTGTYHDGDGTWQRFEVLHTVNGSATQLDIELYVEGTGNGVFSGPVVAFTKEPTERFIEPVAPEGQILTLAADSELPNERVFTPDEFLVGVDGGAGGAYTLTVRPTEETILFWDDMHFYSQSSISTTGVKLNSFETFVGSNYTFVTPSDSVEEHPGRLLLTAGNAGIGGIKLGSWYMSDIARMKFIIKTPAAVTDWEMVAGILDNSLDTDGSVQGIYFNYDVAALSNWRAITHGGTATTTDTGVAFAADTWYVLEIVINAAYDSITFYIDGTLVATHTTNIPTPGGLDVIMVVTRNTTTSTGRVTEVDFVSVYGQTGMTRT